MSLAFSVFCIYGALVRWRIITRVQDTAGELGREKATKNIVQQYINANTDSASINKYDDNRKCLLTLRSNEFWIEPLSLFLKELGGVEVT